MDIEVIIAELNKLYKTDATKYGDVFKDIFGGVFGG